MSGIGALVEKWRGEAFKMREQAEASETDTRRCTLLDYAAMSRTRADELEAVLSAQTCGTCRHRSLVVNPATGSLNELLTSEGYGECAMRHGWWKADESCSRFESRPLPSERGQE